MISQQSPAILHTLRHVVYFLYCQLWGKQRGVIASPPQVAGRPSRYSASGHFLSVFSCQWDQTADGCRPMRNPASVPHVEYGDSVEVRTAPRSDGRVKAQRGSQSQSLLGGLLLFSPQRGRCLVLVSRRNPALVLSLFLAGFDSFLFGKERCWPVVVQLPPPAGLTLPYTLEWLKRLRPNWSLSPASSNTDPHASGSDPSQVRRPPISRCNTGHEGRKGHKLHQSDSSVGHMWSQPILVFECFLCEAN